MRVNGVSGPRPFARAADQRAAASFEAVLASLATTQSATAEAGGRLDPFAATPPFVFESAAAADVTAPGELAFAEFAIGDDGEARQRVDLSDDPEAIRRELALPKDADAAVLRRARRRFMWAHHPDRRPELPRDVANRRVAIANRLIDEALDALKRSR